MHPPSDRNATAPGWGGGGGQSIRRAGGIDTQGSSGVFTRCADGAGCTEVVARLTAADRSYREGYDVVATRLRATAARFAELHNFGADRSAA